MTDSTGDISGAMPTAISTARSNPFAGFVLPFVVSALLAARMIVPTESATRGDTLWITQLWFVAALMWSLLRIVRKTFFEKPDLLDVAVWLIVIGHVVSALMVVNGNKRAAINMLWEWLALGISLTLLRQLVVVERHRRQLTVGMFSIVFCLALLGFWQHFVFYGQAGTAYAHDRAELDRLIQLQVEQPDPGRALRIQDLRQSMQVQGIPLQGQNRILFEQRLQSSSEPFGPFALANSFAALLVGWLVVLVLSVVVRRHQTRAAVITAVILIITTGWCLLLTKSRAAVVGGLIACAAGLVFAKSVVKRGTWIATLAVLATISVVAALSKGLDREVISEAPKSLQYRLEYWAGSLAVVKDAPIFGVGPGNFRQHYLRHKLPESSEEISDPHNSILDAWSNGGLLALFGLGLLGMCAIQGLGRRDERRHTRAFSVAIFDPIRMGMAAGLVCVVAWDWFHGQMSDSRQLYLLGAFFLTMTLATRVFVKMSIPSNDYAAGAVAVMVALLGAGGFGMPAIFQCLLILLSLCFGRQAANANVATKNRHSDRLLGFVLPAVMLGLSLACLQTGFGPVIQSRLSTRMGQVSLQHGRTQTGLRYLQQAISFDPIDPDVFQRLAAAQWNEWAETGRTNSKLWAKAIGSMRKSVILDPMSPGRRRVLARYLVMGGELDDVKQAAREMTIATQMYPNSSEFQAELAGILNKAGDNRSQAAATRGLQLDGLNRRLGHRDRYLPEQLVELLRTIAAKKVD